MKKSFWLTGFIIFSVIFGIIAVIIGNADRILKVRKVSVSAPHEEINPIFVIDPGHGGEDGGCCAKDGTLEKELNMTVSVNLRDTFNTMGYPAVMTRTDDKLLYDMYGDLEDYKGKKKIYDLKNRVRFAEESEAYAMISIHMNKYPSENCHGTQIYYSDNSESHILADKIQNSISKNLQTDNNRATKKAGSNIYILNRVKMNAVLCECGFLSNSDETSKLKDPEYVKKLCLCIAAASVEQLNAVSEK